jgi:hypothetical protein
MRTSSNIDLIPQTKEGIEQAVWINESEIPEKFENAYENIKLVYENL